MFRKDFILQPATDARYVERGPIEVMVPADRVRLLQGQVVEVVAVLPNGQEIALGKEYLKVLRAAWSVLKDQLDNIAGPGLHINEITHLLVPVTVVAPLRTIISAQRLSLEKKHGNLPHIPRSGQNPLYQDALVMEVATAVGFRHVVFAVKERIDNTFYRGGAHQYRAPIADLQYVYNAPDSQSMKHVKSRLIQSVVKAYLDKHLSNNHEVEDCMMTIPAFGNAVRAEEAREKQVRAQNATLDAKKSKHKNA